MILSPELARREFCPIAAISGAVDKDGNAPSHCRADACMFWRWVPIMADDPRFVKAVRDEMDRLHAEKGDPKTPVVSFQNRATANVGKDRAAHGLPTSPERGYCGLAGKVEA